MLTESESTRMVWKKSGASAMNTCVEAAFAGGEIHVRDTKARGTGPTLTFTRSGWAAFLTGAENGEFDLPATGA